MSKKAIIEQSIASYADKLNQLAGSSDKRIRKRILQKLGKLKKELENCEKQIEVLVPSNLNDSKNVASNLTNSQLKMKTKLLNKELSVLARKKQLNMAIKKFNWGLNKGLPLDIHSYTNLLNAYIRCGDIQGAESLYHNMVSTTNIQPNDITKTILIKGYSEQGYMPQAWSIYQSMIIRMTTTSHSHNNNDSINMRTVNTLLRGCIRTGQMKLCKKLYTQLYLKDSNLTSLHTHAHSSKDHMLDVSVYDLDEGEQIEDHSHDNDTINNTAYSYFVTLFAQSLHLEECYRIIHHLDTYNNNNSTSEILPSSFDNYISIASIYISISKALVLIGKFKLATLLLEKTREYLEKSKNSRLKDIMYKKLHDNNEASQTINSHKTIKNTDKKNTDKKATSTTTTTNSYHMSDNKNNDEEMSKSMILFLQHNRQEMKKEMETLLEYIQYYQQNTSLIYAVLQHTLAMNTESIMLINQIYRYMNHLSRLLYFGMNGYGDMLRFHQTKKSDKSTKIEVSNSSSSSNSNSNTSHSSTADSHVSYNTSYSHISEFIIQAIQEKFGLNMLMKALFTADSFDMNNSSTVVNMSYKEENRGEDGLDKIKVYIEYWKKQILVKLIQTFPNCTRYPAIKDAQSSNIQKDDDDKSIIESTDNTSLHQEEIMMGYIDYSTLFQPIAFHPPSSHTQTFSNLTNDGLHHTIGDDSIDKGKKRKKHKSDRTNNNNDSDNDSVTDYISHLFSKQNSIDLSHLPIKLEIGCGSGEWLVNQAAADRRSYIPPSSSSSSSSKSTYTTSLSTDTSTSSVLSTTSTYNIPTALWLGLELRCDRVYDILCHSILDTTTNTAATAATIPSTSTTNNAKDISEVSQQEKKRKMSRQALNTSPSNASYMNTYHEDTSVIPYEQLHNLENVAILGGDANRILQYHISPQSISHIFINHPEPPEHSAGGEKNQGQHLLTLSFFNQMYTILQDDGKITIVTDNLLYAQLLLDILVEMSMTTPPNNLTSLDTVNILQQSLDSTDMVDPATDMQNKTTDENIQQQQQQQYIGFESIILPQDDSRKLEQIRRLKLPQQPSITTTTTTINIIMNKTSSTINQHDLLKQDGNVTMTASKNVVQENTKDSMSHYKDEINRQDRDNKSSSSSSDDEDNDDDDSDDDTNSTASSDIAILTREQLQVARQLNQHNNTTTTTTGNHQNGSSSSNGNISMTSKSINKTTRVTNDDMMTNEQYNDSLSINNDNTTTSTTKKKSLNNTNSKPSQSVLLNKEDTKKSIDNVNISNKDMNEHVLQLWRGDHFGSDIGHITDSSSYFDRLWKQGDKKKRWCIYLKKIKK